MKTLTKMVSLCLCLFAFVFSSVDLEHNEKIKSIDVRESNSSATILSKPTAMKPTFERGPSVNVDPSNRDCAETFMVYGSDPTGYADICWDDGSGYFYFYWEGGCLALSIEYSGGVMDLSSYGFTEGFYFYGFEPGFTDTFIMEFDDGSVGAGEATTECATCEELGQVTCWDGSCADTEADCPAAGECPAGETIDCVDDTECWTEAWIGDGYPDCDDEQYGANLCCYDLDGGDCTAEQCDGTGDGGTSGGTTGSGCVDCIGQDCTGYESWIGDGLCDDGAWGLYFNCDEFDCDGGDCLDADGNCAGGDGGGTTGGDDGGGEGDCEWDASNYGAADCDAAWEGFGEPYTCEYLELYLGWDCTGCACPGDGPSCEDQGLYECCDGSCASDPNDCAECDCLSVGGNEGWLGDGWCDMINNNEYCGFDAGDCCPGDCVDSTYSCDTYGGDCTVCLDCDSADNAAGGQCAGDGVGEGDDCSDGDPCADIAAGDANGDGFIDVLDIVQIVNHILETVELTDCALVAGDYNGDGFVDVLDIVQVVNIILSGRDDDASHATITINEGVASIEADGFVGAVQMTLEHGGDFSINLTNDALVADYATDENSTTLIVVAPESALFTTSGDFTVTEFVAANSSNYITVNLDESGTGDGQTLENDNNSSMPSVFTLENAYPNPFNPSTSLKMYVPASGKVVVNVYNASGKLVEELYTGFVGSGYRTITWNAAADLSSGVYMIHATMDGSTSLVEKVMLLK